LDRYMNETRPVHFRLNQNYPNPFNVSTIITYSVSEETFVSLKISDLTGREIETLIYKKQNPGYYHVIYKAKDLASGIYFVRMKAGNFQDKKSMILMK